MTRFPKWVPVIAGLVTAAFIGVMWQRARRAELDVANPLGQSVTVWVDGEGPVKVDALSAEPVGTFSAGPHTIDVRGERGQSVETSVVMLRGHGWLTVYNVLGLAPVYFERIVYSRYAAPSELNEVACGKRFVEFEDVDYRWVDPPQVLSIDSKTSSVTKRHLGLAKGGLRACVGYAYQRDVPFDEGAAAHFDEGEPPDAQHWRSTGLVLAHERAEALALVRRALAAEPRSVEWHREWQDLFLMQGDEASVRPEYDARAQADGATADDLYLAIRLAPHAEQLERSAGALKRFPESGWLRWAYALALADADRGAEALPHFERLLNDPSDLPAPIKGSVAEHRVAILGRLGRTGEAKSALALTQTSSPNLKCELMARSLGGPAVTPNGPSPFVVLLEAKEHGVPYPPLDVANHEARAPRDAKELAVDSLWGPDVGLRRAAKASPLLLRMMPLPVRLLLLSEAWRTGQTEAARRLADATDTEVPRLDEVRRFLVTGNETAALWQCEDWSRAALWFSRARWAETPAARAHALRRLAAVDVPGGLATLAQKQWPQPTTPPETARPWAFRLTPGAP